MFWKKKRPDAVMVAQRISVLYFVAQYGLAKMEPGWIDQLFPEGAGDQEASKQDMEGFLAKPMAYLDHQGLKPMLTPDERGLFGDPSPSREDLASAIYRLNAYGALTWAMRLTSGFSYDKPTTIAELEVLPNNFATYARTAKLRPQHEIDTARDLAELWHWRSRTRHLIEMGEPFPEELRPHGYQSFDDIVRRTAKERGDEGEITVIDEDFAALGKAYRDLTDEEWGHVSAITLNRHLALNWLCGYAPGHRWDQTPTET